MKDFLFSHYSIVKNPCVLLLFLNDNTLYIIHCKAWALFFSFTLFFFYEAIGFGWKHGGFGYGSISAFSPGALSHPDYWAMVHAPWGKQHISVGSLSTITNTAMLTWQEPSAGSEFGPGWSTLLGNSIEQYWLRICTRRTGWQCTYSWAANTLGGRTCVQLMCVTETGEHTGLVLGASANFISDVNSAVVTSEGICKKAMTYFA